MQSHKDRLLSCSAGWRGTAGGCNDLKTCIDQSNSHFPSRIACFSGMFIISIISSSLGGQRFGHATASPKSMDGAPSLCCIPS